MDAPRIRDFIETTDGLIFASVSYHHPPDRRLAFLRYYPDTEGERERSGVRYKKIASTAQSFEFLEKNYPESVFSYQGARLQGVPVEKIKKIHRGEDKLKKICRNPETPLEKKIKRLSDTFRNIPHDHKGITGSVLVGLDTPDSDIDFVVYGVENHKRAREIFENSASGRLCELKEDEWRRSYEKRFSGHDTLSFDEYLWHERRKWHKGTFEGVIFDILLVRDRSEIGAPPKPCERKEKIKIECRVKDAAFAFDSPSIYKVEYGDGRIKEVLSYTHTYAGQAFKGEEIEVCGFLEEAKSKKCRVIVGTTREAKDEYIKVIRT
ncbi:nucleotidyltransferase domain-containing protein [archaeon]|nr:nucleotidyltransferase domain-containing protein [archaeon]